MGKITFKGKPEYCMCKNQELRNDLICHCGKMVFYIMFKNLLVGDCFHSLSGDHYQVISTDVDYDLGLHEETGLSLMLNDGHGLVIKDIKD